ncbi:isoleucine--tRNA ligase [Candidatus Nomurabacteria bacterium]|nr:isoleucine--tRNA ligase [Candidatus Nomurabacteria bacterium]MCB9803318.1 isoleucine--tRNA ligase [Candidatus Nomurabacteria bacterium]
MSKIKEAEQRASFPKMEEKISEFWKKNDLFKKSIEQRPEDERFSFVDGPPFVSGMPHPAHLFVSIAKDVIPRYWTMKGKRVRRVFGWDCHGLPIEAKVNMKYKLKGRKQIEEEFGVDRYVKECRKYVEEFSENWRWYIEKIGRWADMDNAYYTMYPEFNESVIWAFKQAWEKGLIYKGKRVSLYSTDTATPVSNFEVAMDPDNYQDTEDLAIFLKFKLKEHPWKDIVADNPVHMLAWTTTPWTIPSNFALAVNEAFDYVLVEFNGEYFILSEVRLEYAFDTSEQEIGEDAGKTVQILKRLTGSELEGLEYYPAYDHFVDRTTKNDFKVYLLDDVTNDEGTGVLHIAPAFGDVDFQFGLKMNLSFHSDIDEEGNMVVEPWKGVYLRDASPLMAEDMSEKGLLLRTEPYVHRLPFYRGDNPLIYMAQDAYFLDVQKLKDRMLELNQNVNWYPEHYKNGRFAETVGTSPDWTISRSRYWATVMPLWVNEKGEEIVVGSIEEMREMTDQIDKKEVDGKTKYFVDGEPFSFHRDICDKIVLTKDGVEYHRVPEVLDCWMDSGSVPFAEYHYPFENEETFNNAFPADFIVEYSGQVRAWFNVLFRMSTFLFDKEPFKNVVCHGVLSGNDGRKMSKTYGNYTDPEDVLKNLGGEAMRLYGMGSPLMAGGDMNWSDEELNERVKTILIPYWNTYRYLTMYANLHDWTPTDDHFPIENILDRWLASMVKKAVKEYSEAIEGYDIPSSVKVLQPTIDAVSTWWIRRSRDRFANGDTDALQALYATLVLMSKAFAPQMPFLMEEFYQNLVVNVGLDGAKESVHLEDYPSDLDHDEKLLEDMSWVQTLCSLGLNIRDENRLKLRQPLLKAVAPIEDPDLRSILKAELNVREVDYSKTQPKDKDHLTVVESNGLYLGLDLNLTEDLLSEGLMNELARQIQVQRKEKGLQVGEIVSLHYVTQSKALADVVQKWTDELKGRLSVDKILLASSSDDSMTELKVNDELIWVKLEAA